MNYDDYKEAKERVAKHRDITYDLSCEEIAAIDIAQQIGGYEWAIEDAQSNLKRLYKAAKKLPKPKKQLVDDIDPQIIKEAKYKFRGKRDLQRKLYMYDEIE